MVLPKLPFPKFQYSRVLLNNVRRAHVNTEQLMDAPLFTCSQDTGFPYSSVRQGVNSPNQEHQLYLIRQRSSSSKSKISDLEEQERLTNLGAMINCLKEQIPTLLRRSLPKAIVSSRVLLQVCPSYFESIHHYLPSIKGHISYYATCKAAQIFLTSFILNPQTHIHVQSIRASNFSGPGCLNLHSTRIFARWSTCPEGCSHLSVQDGALNTDTDKSAIKQHFTAKAKLGFHGWSGIDASQMLDESKHNWLLSGSIVNLGKGVVGLKKDDSKLERIISGIFIFELNEKNDEIVVHTIENLNIIEKGSEHHLENKLRVCG